MLRGGGCYTPCFRRNGRDVPPHVMRAVNPPWVAPRSDQRGECGCHSTGYWLLFCLRPGRKSQEVGVRRAMRCAWEEHSVPDQAPPDENDTYWRKSLRSALQETIDGGRAPAGRGQLGVLLGGCRRSRPGWRRRRGVARSPRFRGRIYPQDTVISGEKTTRRRGPRRSRIPMAG